MKLTTYQSPADFLRVVEETLLRREAQHGLMLGICGRLVTNPTYYGSAPFLATVHQADRLVLAALMTPPQKLQLCAEDNCDPEAVQVLADTLLAEPWLVPAVLADQPLAEAFAAVWCERTGARSHVGMRQRIHELRTVVAPRPLPGAMAPAGEADIPVASAWIQAFHEEAMHDAEPRSRAHLAETMIHDDRLYFWNDGSPRSMAARTRPTPHGECIGAVYTPPPFRGRGFASALVAALSQHILDAGKSFVTLFTDLANPTSNYIYRAIGFNPVADRVDIKFSGDGPSSSRRSGRTIR